MSRKLEERNWELLLRRIKAGKCTPFLGAGACYGTLPLGGKIAKDWAKKYKYPLDDHTNLARVAQYLAVEYDPTFPKERLLEQFQKTSPPNFEKSNEIHRVLAKLPLPTYMTTNYDDFMKQALEIENRAPRREICQWNKLLDYEDSVFAKDPDYNPTVANPLVFHLHGHNGMAESLVLTEDDYLDFLVRISEDKELINKRIRKEFVKTSLLFLGYRLADTDFRVLFRSLVGYLGKNAEKAHVSVQLNPMGEKVSPEKQKSAQTYLDNYFRDLKIQVFWGTCEEFAIELSKRWAKFNNNG